MIKIKKLVILVALLYPLFLASCQSKENNVSVSYILDGKVVEVIELKSGDKAPQLDEYADVEWQYNGEKYDFDLKVEKDIILIGKIGTLPTNKFVDILSLTAIQESLVAKQSCVLTSLIMSDDTKEEKITDFSHNQYIVMYKSQSEITFTIKLNNPKGESIDAIELTCDDPNAQIMVDGEYKPIQYQDNEGVKSRIVNWAQEDPYEKVYYIKTTSMDDINTLRVIDLKVNGEWQNHPLSNDELKIYKMNEEDLKWVFMKNTPEYYQWKFEKSDKISNLVVKLGTELEPDENGVYTTVSGKVVWEYDYTFDGVTVHWKDERDIETVSWVYDSKVFILTYSSYEPIQHTIGNNFLVLVISQTIFFIL